MTKAKIMFTLNGTVHNETIDGYRIGVTTEPDGRAVVLVYDEGDIKTRAYVYRVFEKCEVVYDQNKVDPVPSDRQAGQDPSVRAHVPDDPTSRP